jgi:signal transduction histidine kinase
VTTSAVSQDLNGGPPDLNGGPPDLRGGPPVVAVSKRKLVFAGLGALMCTVVGAVALTSSAPESERPIVALGYALAVAIPIAIGLYFWYRQPQSRFGLMLVLAGLGWSLATLAASDSSFLYSVGRVSLWVIEPLVVYLVLAFPSGRLTTPSDRALVAAFVGIAAVLFLPTAFLVDAYPENSPLTTCQASCPANFFMLLNSTPAFVEPIATVREILIMLVFIGVASRLFHRIRHATDLTRRTISPVLVAAIARVDAYVAFLLARRVAPDSHVVDVIGWILLATLPAIAIGFLVGMLRWRLYVASALEHLAQGVMARPNRANLRAALAETLEDPELEIASRGPGNPGGWIGSDGASVDIDQPGLDRTVTTISDNGRPSFALIHDSQLSEHRDFVDAVASVAVFASENEQLTARLRSSLRELERSRMRLVSAADNERRRIERDLHDGAQQRLVALRIKLELADELMTVDPTHAHKLIHELGPEIDQSLEEVRSLARGIYPSLLVDQGLQEALSAVALRMPVPTHIECEGVSRYPAEIESTVYFSCLEAIQNAVKHARGATVIQVSVAGNGRLLFEVRDDGEGFDSASAIRGQGLTNIHDRLVAVGGELSVRSTPGQGTVVRGAVPAEVLVGGA